MKNIKLIAMALILVIVIGFGVYMTMASENVGNDKDHEIDNGENLSVNDSLEDDVFDTPFYYERLERETLDNEVFVKEDFFRGSEGWIQASVEPDGMYLRNLETKEEIAKFDRDFSYQYYFYVSREGDLWQIPLYIKNHKLSIIESDLQGNIRQELEVKDLGDFMLVDGERIQIQCFKVVANHIYINANTEKGSVLQIYDLNGELIRKHNSVTQFDVEEDGNYVLGLGGVGEIPIIGLVKFDIQSGQEIFRVETPYPNVIKISEDEKKVVVASGDKIFLVDLMTGGRLRTLLEFGKDTSYLIDDYRHKDLAMTANGTLWVSLFTREQPTALVKDSFQKVQGTRVVKEPTLVFTAPYRSEFVLEAIKRYELKYPEEHVLYDYDYNTYEAFLNDREAYAQKLVLRIINNEVGDVVQSGGAALPYWSLAQTDVFMDIEPMLKSLSYYDDLNQNVLEAIRIGGKIKALPAFYHFYQFDFNEQLGDALNIKSTDDLKWSDVMKWVERLDEKSPNESLFNHSNVLEYILENILITNMPDLVDLESKTVNLNQKWFKDLLSQFKNISQYKNLELRDPVFDRADLLQNALMRVWAPTGYLGDETYFYEIGLEKRPSKMISSFIGEKNSNRIGYSKHMYSINQRTENPEKAWQFLSFLVTEEVQNTMRRDGVPLNKKSLNKRIDDAELKMKNKPLIYEKWVTPYINNAEKVDLLYDMGSMKADFAFEIKRYLSDEITLDEALKNAEQKIMIRLNE